MMPTELELMHMHVHALFTHTAHTQIARVNEPDGGGPAPRLFIGRTPAGNIWRVRADLPAHLAAALAERCASEPVSGALQEPPRYLAEYRQLLAAQAPIQKQGMGPAYAFTHVRAPDLPLHTLAEGDAALLEGGFEDMVAELPAWQPFLALVVERRAVAICRSVRITAAAHEAGVETLPAFRGRGYAQAVVSGWAQAVRALGVLPLYSTSWENSASRALAAKLGLAPFGSDFHIT